MVYSPARKLCSNPLYIVKGMSIKSLLSLRSLNVARKVVQKFWLPMFFRKFFASSPSMLSRKTATRNIARTPTPTEVFQLSCIWYFIKHFNTGTYEEKLIKSLQGFAMLRSQKLMQNSTISMQACNYLDLSSDFHHICVTRHVMMSQHILFMCVEHEYNEH